MIFRILEDQYADKAKAAKGADRRFMDLALTLGRHGLGRTAPNPSVGAVIVKDGVIVGRGRTQDGGRPHAEVEALRQAGEAARGGTLYVTLEPCSHVGRSPPCADAVIAAGVARVVSAIADPNPEVAGQGHSRLRAAGIAVDVGLCGEVAARDHAGHFRRVRQDRPHVILKLAVSSDGMIGAAGRKPVAITGEATRARVHLLRAQCDAILIGVGTVLADDPELTCRLPGMAAQSPIRVVLDSALRTPFDSRLVASARAMPLWIVAAETADAPAAARLAAAGATVIPMPVAANGFDIARILTMLADRGVTRLMVEGGSRVASTFVEQGVADEVWLIQGPNVIGPDGVPALGAMPLSAIAASPKFRARGSEMWGDDSLTVYDRNPRGERRFFRAVSNHEFVTHPSRRGEDAAPQDEVCVSSERDMFTGIITDQGVIESLTPVAQGQLHRLRIGCSYERATIADGASIACNGVCLTVVASGVAGARTWFDVDAAAETLAMTTAKHWRTGNRLNLERALKIGDELGGHIVAGHVDGVADIVGRDDLPDMARFTLRTTRDLARFIATKGSVTLDGVSLTVNTVADCDFSVLIIPHTLSVTTLGTWQVGGQINLEVDLMARYAARLGEMR